MSSSGTVLSAVSIRNFKSIREATIELGPLTVLVGENSAGKSTVLQLLFLLAQIASDRSRPDVVSLNGAELSLGNFEDVLHDGAQGESIEVGLTAEMTGGSTIRGARPSLARGMSVDRHSETHRATWKLTIEEPGDQLGVAQIASIEIIDSAAGERLLVEPNPAQEEMDEVYRYSRAIGSVRRKPPTRARLLEATAAPSRFTGFLEGFGDQEEQAHDELLPAVAVENGFPVEAYSYADEFPFLARRWLDFVELAATRGHDRLMLSRLRRQRRLDETRHVDPSDIAEELFPMFRSWIDVFDRTARLPSPSEVEPVDYQTLESVVGIKDDLAVALSDLFQSYREPKQAIEEFRSAWTVDVSVGLKALLSTSVHYLGPLRDEPKLSYRPGQSGGVATLGVTGEYWVAALDMYGARIIACPMPGGGATHMPLLDAVNIWAKRFGIADEVRTEDKGRLGLEPQIADPQTGALRDPTSVGVGVSQLLPVIVICLMAQPGELVLLEQPELHLHPGPQQVLGDFFLGLSDTGRQVVVETHSEYLVNRLRLRIAEDEYGEVQDAVSLLYARRSEGESSFSPILANRYGSLEKWPEGFFDQSPLEAEAIMRAAAQKRRRKDQGPSAVAPDEQVEVFAEYQGHRVDAVFNTGTESIALSWAPLEGQVFGSPSGAAIAVVRELNPDVSPNRNGWRFWTVAATGAPLGSIRK